MSTPRKAPTMYVRTDEAGQILSVFWPNVPAEGAPTRTGVRLAPGENVHEVPVPDEVSAGAAPAEFFARHGVSVGTDGRATLTPSDGAS
ncbi:hypothetical protein [Actinophytocola sp.]|uniref:hypothetical protein n=1 Tax=Actinophytocola sp. TaxID=1872138 RepID=UPI002D3C4E74|nr:hypothetical protein [Actinophytocola sp.]HYQ65016.1 hypothetical protein [Actinophytocola sp.]